MQRSDACRQGSKRTCDGVHHKVGRVHEIWSPVSERFEVSHRGLSLAKIHGTATFTHNKAQKVRGANTTDGVKTQGGYK